MIASENVRTQNVVVNFTVRTVYMYIHKYSYGVVHEVCICVRAILLSFREPGVHEMSISKSPKIKSISTGPDELNLKTHVIFDFLNAVYIELIVENQLCMHLITYKLFVSLVRIYLRKITTHFGPHTKH